MKTLNMVQQNSKIHGVERPVDNLKFTAYKNVLEDNSKKTAYEQAVELIVAKHPVLGEPVVVPINYTHADGNQTLELVFGIGSADENHPYISCSVNNNIGDEIKVSDDDSSTGFITLKEKLENIIETTANNVTEFILNDVDFKEQFIQSLMEGDTIQNTIQREVEKTLRWKSLTELIK